MSENQLTVQTIDAPVYTFKVPASARQYKTDPESFSVRAWSLAQDEDARAVERVSRRLLDYLLLERALVKINGKPVDQAQDLLADWSPKCRQFGIIAIGHVGVPDNEETAAFLASVQVEAA